MDTSLRGGIPFARAVVDGLQDRNVPFMAASIAYSAFLSLVPLIVLLFFLVSALGDDALAAEVASLTEGFLPESGQGLLEESIAGSVGTAGTSIIGLVALVWGSLKIFRGIDTAFSEIYDSAAESTLLTEVRDGLVVLVGLGLALTAAVVATAAFGLFPDVPFLGLANPLLLVVGLTVAFLPMYYFFPNVDVTVREALPGAVVAAVGWAALQALFQVYVAVASESESAGAVGAILILLTWLYFGGMVLLVGAVVNAVSAGYLHTGEEAGHEELAVRRVERDRARLEREYETMAREYGLARNDAAAYRSRRDELERETKRLEREHARLERENEELRGRLERQDDPEWQRVLERLFDRVETVNIATVRSGRDDR